MTTAAECLQLGWPQKRISDYLGFSELSAFSRVFQAYFRISPGRFRESKTSALGDYFGMTDEPHNAHPIINRRGGGAGVYKVFGRVVNPC